MTARSTESRVTQIASAVLTTRPEDLFDAIAQYNAELADAAMTEADVVKYEKAKLITQSVVWFRARLVDLMGDPLAEL